MSHIADDRDDSGRSDDQATTTFEPISTSVGDDVHEAAREPSPWASPESDYYAPSTTVSPTVADPQFASTGDYGTSPTAAQPNAVALPPVQQRQPQGIRGLFLGTLAMLLIGAVFALYLYDAWLSESARSTVEGWLPWLDN